MASTGITFKGDIAHVTLVNGAVLSGILQSSRDGRPFSSFLGIRYANIPGRFQEAELIKGGGWKEEVFGAIKPGSPCPQALAGRYFGEEDCLFLNIYVPKTSGDKKLPVMVWVHGGAFMFGEGSGYGPNYFMDEDVILVTINYRLGIFGFFSTGDEVIPGNNGLKDQVLALRWVKENIQFFKGDAENVTIFGESAGSVSISYLMLSPLANGLFHRAISQSGTALAPWASQSNPRKVAVQLAEYLKADNPSEMSSEEIVAFLKGFTAEELTMAQVAFMKRWPSFTTAFAFRPVKEPDSTPNPFLTRLPWEMVMEKDIPFANVPWLLGATEDEGCTFYAGIVLNSQELMDELNLKWNEIAPLAFCLDQYISEGNGDAVAEKIHKFYLKSKKVCSETRESLTNLYSDMMFNHSVYKAGVEAAARGNPVYLYEYAYHGPASLLKLFMLPLADEETKKIGHGDELLLQFNLDSLTGRKSLLKGDSGHELFSRNFVKLWTSFAIHGEPKHTWGKFAGKKWEKVGREAVNGKEPVKWHRIDSTVSIVEDLNKERMEFCNKLWKEHLILTEEMTKL